MAKFSGSKKFSQLDLAGAYLQLRLDKTSQTSTTISIHRRLFQCKRLVFELKTAPAIFQKAIEQALAGLDKPQAIWMTFLSWGQMLLPTSSACSRFCGGSKIGGFARGSRSILSHNRRSSIWR